MDKENKHKIRNRLAYFTFVILIVFIGLEVLLRIYNPFHFYLKYNQIVLPVNQKQLIHNNLNPKIDKEIINTRNALGFRGPEKPDSLENYLSIITVGGSTTECHFLSDNKTWPYLLGENLKKSFSNVWVNNAGFDGHSTFGHNILLNDYLKRLHPRFITFLVGVNEVENDAPTFHDKLNIKGAYPDFKHYLFANSEVLNLGLNFLRGWRAQKFNNTTNNALDLVNYRKIDLPVALMNKRLENQKIYLQNFEDRLLHIVDTCKKYNIYPVLITQPNLMGSGKDSVTGADLERFEIDDSTNGKLLWEILSCYNQITKNVAEKEGVAYIDLANFLPKNSLYFYDVSHYTNIGAQKVAEIISRELGKIINSKYPQFSLEKG